MKILIAEDSPVYRMVLKSILRKIDGVSEVVTAPNGALALTLIRKAPCDLLITDLEMPEKNGIELLRSIKHEFPEIPFMVVSSLDKFTTEMGMDALQMGALDFIQKPDGLESDSFKAREFFEDKLLKFIGDFLRTRAPLRNSKELESKESHHEKGSSKFDLPVQPVKITGRKKPGLPHAIFIGLSTGGPKALTEIIPKITPEIKVPIVIVLHIPPGFSTLLADRLNSLSKLNVKEAQSGDILRPGVAYLAPGGLHTKLTRVGAQFALQTEEGPPVHGCRPSVDVFLESASRLNFFGALALILTGMGADGTEGVRKLKSQGCNCIVQDQESSVVWGMPGSIVDAGLADEVVALNKIVGRIHKICGVS